MKRLLLVLCLCFPGLPVVAQQVQDMGASALAEINAIRSQNSRDALAHDPALTAAATSHARDMAQAGFFGHAGSDGSGIGDRVGRTGYGFCFVAENIAKGQGSLGEVLAGWMNSTGHRQNLLHKQADDFGLVRGPGDIWVMVLGRAGC